MASGVSGNFVQVNAALAAIIPRVQAADEAVEEAGGQMVATLAAARAPRLTGELSSSVNTEGETVVVATGYAGYVEYGTRHRAATPFLRPAKDAAEIPWRRTAEGIYTVATR